MALRLAQVVHEDVRRDLFGQRDVDVFALTRAKLDRHDSFRIARRDEHEPVASRMERAAPARGRSIRLFYATQTGTHPPSIVLFCNDPRHVHFSFERFLRNNLRERFGFGAVPIRIRFRGKGRTGRTKRKPYRRSRE